MPAITSTFKSGEPSLPDILREINDGKIQLPDFQRGWVWDDDHIASLIASISLSYPIGAVMLLQTGGDGIQFQPRPIQCVKIIKGAKPEYLILDGQQRMTSLYLAMFSNEAVPTTTNKGKDIQRYYYLDIVKCLNPNEDRLDAVLSVPSNKTITSDFGRKFAAENYNLREDWEKREYRIHDQDVLKGMDATAFLTSVTLLSTYQRNMEDALKPVTCKRKDVLRITLEEYKKNADIIEEGLKKTARFLAREKIFDSRTLPYSTQLIPLSVICALLDGNFEIDTNRRKLAHWFWCGVFGELYGGANETRFAMDVPDFMAWIDGKSQPRTIRDAGFSPTRLLSMQSRLSAAYKGLMALLMKEGSNDFLSGDPIEITSYFDLAIDIHHIFPKSYCENNYKRNLWNSSVNKAPLSAKTNRIIGGKAPSAYLKNIEKQSKMDSSRLDEILKTHKIDPNLLRFDDFENFIRDRASKILDLIEIAMDKKISGRDSDEVIHEYGDVLN